LHDAFGCAAFLGAFPETAREQRHCACRRPHGTAGVHPDAGVNRVAVRLSGRETGTPSARGGERHGSRFESSPEESDRREEGRDAQEVGRAQEGDAKEGNAKKSDPQDVVLVAEEEHGVAPLRVVIAQEERGPQEGRIRPEV
jgi:hypothetical protein